MGNCVVKISRLGRVLLTKGDEVIVVMARPSSRTHTQIAIAAEQDWRISRREPDDDRRRNDEPAATD